jgi:hypothetical protein
MTPRRHGTPPREPISWSSAKLLAASACLTIRESGCAGVLEFDRGRMLSPGPLFVDYVHFCDAPGHFAKTEMPNDRQRIFQMKTGQQLFKKLLKDHQRLQQSPTDSELWFNFIVTADHLPEWHLDADEDKAKALRNSCSLLRICHHLSRNAKHFIARHPKPKDGMVTLSPVSSTTESRVDQVCLTDCSKPRRTAGSPEFYLELSPAEVAELGTKEISGLDFAALLVGYWRARISIAGSQTGPADAEPCLENPLNEC